MNAQSFASRAEGAPAGRDSSHGVRSDARPSGGSDTQRFIRLKADFAEIESRDWTLVEDGQGGFVEVTGAFGERVVLLRFDMLASSAEKMFVADVLENMRFAIGLIDRAIEKLKPEFSASRAEGAPAGRAIGRDARSGLRPAAGGERDTSKDYAAEAAMKCGEPAFMAFLAECHGLERPLSPEKATGKLRTLLGVTSRRELNDDARAADRWKKLRGEFDAWRRRG